MRRYHSQRDERIRRRNMSEHRRLVHDEDDNLPNMVNFSIIMCPCKGCLNLGRFRKKDAYDCGKTCLLCHWEKLLGLPRRSDIKAELKLLEGAEEAGERRVISRRSVASRSPENSAVDRDRGHGSPLRAASK